MVQFNNETNYVRVLLTCLIESRSNTVDGLIRQAYEYYSSSWGFESDEIYETLVEMENIGFVKPSVSDRILFFTITTKGRVFLELHGKAKTYSELSELFDEELYR
jgi:hypothetical protein